MGFNHFWNCVLLYAFLFSNNISQLPTALTEQEGKNDCWDADKMIVFFAAGNWQILKKNILSASQETFGLSYFVRPLIISQWKQECDFRKYFISLWHMTRRHGSWTALNFWELTWNCSTWELEKLWVKSGPNNVGVVVTSEMSRQHADFNDW